MKIAVINAGSSSLKLKLFDMQTQEVLLVKHIQNIGEKESVIQTHHEAIKSLGLDFTKLDAIGHRVVHGGAAFSEATLINTEVIAAIHALIPLAPLHNPANLEGILVCQKKAPNIPQIAVFDTAFHTTMPKEAYLYALPLEMYEKYKIRRYGFHGSSHAYVAKKASEILQKPLHALNLITLHLGNGASVCAVQKGVSIDTSMGFTPLEGLIMGSRCGDIDASIVLYMQRELGMSLDEVDILLNKKSGLLGISGISNVRTLEESESENARLALAMMIRRIQKYVGGYMALLGYVDAIVFTGGIGENSVQIREAILESVLFANIKSLVIQTDEELEIAIECLGVLEKIKS
ncbi:MAG TPA: acetate kinase [Sulfurimonas sp. UBA12504]|nr:MAG: acetate kinase [Sulfurimonas sp. GWF2_37_8]DAB31084.1 MAG TPA: acetate kinase [Sulfurimonas sp. UBA12504]